MQRRSKRGGYGVFAEQSFKRGEIVDQCKYVVVLRETLPNELLDYVYDGEVPEYVNVVLGNGMLFNHARKANLDYCLGSGHTFIFRSIKSIKLGDELTHDYGKRWWAGRSGEQL